MSNKQRLDCKKVNAEADARVVFEWMSFSELCVEDPEGLLLPCLFDCREKQTEGKLLFNTSTNTFRCKCCNAEGSLLDFIMEINFLDNGEAAKLIQLAMEQSGAFHILPAMAEVADSTDTTNVTNIVRKLADSQYGYTRYVRTLDEILAEIQAGVVDKSNIRCVDISMLRQLHITDVDYAVT